MHYTTVAYKERPLFLKRELPRYCKTLFVRSHYLISRFKRHQTERHDQLRLHKIQACDNIGNSPMVILQDTRRSGAQQSAFANRQVRVNLARRLIVYENKNAYQKLMFGTVPSGWIRAGGAENRTVVFQVTDSNSYISG